MTKHKFQIIKGGVSGSPSSTGCDKRFVSAFVTDTRLMGVLALYIHWETCFSGEEEDFHQFFYFDAEEYGLDTYESLRGSDPAVLDSIEQGLTGGLGGSKIPVTLREAAYLLQTFMRGSKDLNVTPAGPAEEYEDLLKEDVILSESEINAVVDKICTPILSDYHLIHYFLMRSFAKDREGASYLVSGHVDLIEPPSGRAATLYKNTIEEHFTETGAVSYLCEAVIDMDGKYELEVLEITVADKKITSAVRHSSFRISGAEAAMMLNRPEYVSVYEIMSEPEGFDDNFLPMMASTMQSNHENGRLFMEFNKNNDHVNRRVFSLNEDVRGLYYVSDFGQLIIAAYNLNEIHSIENTIQKSPLSRLVLATAKYEFKEAVVYDFIQSDFDDFEEFILSLQ
ncbi:hypothetical protein MASR2M70_20720 [Bacillota bacterium]